MILTNFNKNDILLGDDKEADFSFKRQALSRDRKPNRFLVITRTVPFLLEVNMPSGVYVRTKPVWNKGISIKKNYTCPVCKKIFRGYESCHRITCSKKCNFKNGADGNFGKEGTLHPSWKGDNASYGALHGRVEKKRGKPKFCEICKTTDKKKIYEWANLTGRYLDIMDYQRMCNVCHRKYDRERRKLYGKQFSSHSAR